MYINRINKSAEEIKFKWSIEGRASTVITLAKDREESIRKAIDILGAKNIGIYYYDQFYWNNYQHEGNIILFRN